MNYKINKIAEGSIKECRNNGIELTDIDIITLYELGKIAEDTINTGFRYYCGKPLGNIRIYPLTLGARLWLNYEAKELCQFDNDLYSWAVAWAFAHSFEADKFLFDDYKHLKKTIIKWGRKINCTDEEFTQALVTMGEIDGLNVEDDNEKNEKNLDPRNPSNEKSSISAVLNFFLTEFGKDISYWLWEVSESQANKLMIEFINKESGKKVISSDDLPIKAYIKMRQYIDGLKQSIKAIEDIEEESKDA